MGKVHTPVWVPSCPVMSLIQHWEQRTRSKKWAAGGPRAPAPPLPTARHQTLRPGRRELCPTWRLSNLPTPPGEGKESLTGELPGSGSGRCGELSSWSLRTGRWRSVRVRYQQVSSRGWSEASLSWRHLPCRWGRIRTPTCICSRDDALLFPGIVRRPFLHTATAQPRGEPQRKAAACAKPQPQLWGRERGAPAEKPAHGRSCRAPGSKESLAHAHRATSEAQIRRDFV